MNSLAIRIKTAIDSEGAEQLARRTRISRATLYNLARGSAPRLQTLRKLRRAGVAIPRNLFGAV